MDACLIICLLPADRDVEYPRSSGSRQMIGQTGGFTIPYIFTSIPVSEIVDTIIYM